MYSETKSYSAVVSNYLSGSVMIEKIVEFLVLTVIKVEMIS